MTSSIATDCPLLDEAVEAYLECLLWSSTYSYSAEDDDLRPIDDDFGIASIEPACRAKAADEVLDLLTLPESELWLERYDVKSLGHNFCLARNRQGSSFTDDDNGPLGEKMNELARSFSEVWATVEDGKVYID